MKSESGEIKIYSDGGARGNPGPAAIGFVVFQNDQQLFEGGKKIGITTNNVAEYRAVTEALQWFLRNPQGRTRRLKFFLDSQLVVNQLKGIYKIKNPKLQLLFAQIKQLEREIFVKYRVSIIFSYIPREKNKIADNLVNKSLDDALF